MREPTGAATARASKLKEELYKRAVALWTLEHSGHPTGTNGKPLSLEKICAEISQQHFDASNGKEDVSLAASTLDRLVKGGVSQRAFNSSKRWLSDEEEQAVVDYAIEMAQRAFPLDRQTMRKHVNEIIWARATPPEGFPESGVGQNFVDRLIHRHWDQLCPAWSKSLEYARASGANATAKAEFFELYIETRERLGIDDDCVFGADETGLQTGLAPKRRVYKPQGSKVQHTRDSGTRENITVLPVICGDGEWLPPAVIFKGQGFQPSWKQDNPLKASLGYQKKGYIDGEISAEWIKHFDAETRAKARGRARLLIVDGHVSHYTKAFLDYAIANNIHVLCYPSHSTHLFQGLDVVLFGPLKKRWSVAKRDAESKRITITKENFLSFYAPIHKATFTESNIKAAFRKTGLIPFNPDMIPDEALAPSIEVSTVGRMPLAGALPSPVRAAADYIAAFQDGKKRKGTDAPGPSRSSPYIPQTPRRPRTIPAFHQSPSSSPGRSAFDEMSMDLESTSARFLTSSSPIHSSSSLPPIMTYPISPPSNHYALLLRQPPRDILEESSQNAIRNLQKELERQKQMNRVVQAQLVLQNRYVAAARADVFAKEEKAKRKRGKTALHADGSAKLLTDPAFIDLVDKKAREKSDAAAGKEQRRFEKEAAARAKLLWEAEDLKRRERNVGKLREYDAALKLWEAEAAAAKEARPSRKPRWTKPVKPKAEKAAPKTWVRRRTKKGAAATTEELGGAEDDTASGSGSSSEDE